MNSALYVGEVRHIRLRPRNHRLRYRVFMLLLDLDELPALFARLRLLAKGRFGLTSFEAADHGQRDGGSLRDEVAARLAEAGVPAGGAIRLLCMPRVLGHGFNPLSLYFCHRPDGSLAAILYEVTNTFGDRHSYLIAVAPGEEVVVRQEAAKRLHVSPFMDMDLTYRFTVRPPGNGVAVHIVVEDDEGPMLVAAFAGERRALTDAALLRAWLAHPLMTLKVVGAIHWEALWIWLKGVAYRRRPAPPAEPVSIGSGLAPRTGAPHA